MTCHYLCKRGIAEALPFDQILLRFKVKVEGIGIRGVRGGSVMEGRMVKQKVVRSGS